jgi:L-arabinose isomerase
MDKNKNTWLITGSQHLYGPDILKKVEAHASEICKHLNFFDAGVVTTPEEIFDVIAKANADKNCFGIVCWMHTFSPAKMWIRGLNALNKPLLHFHTQYNRDIPYESIDMDFMNLNQSAHGDREFAHMLTRMNISRKTVVGHWQEEGVRKKIDRWQRACAAWADWQGARFVRFGDNMRYVAVTDGDKVEAERQFGFSVNSCGVGDLVEELKKVSPENLRMRIEEYLTTYKFDAPNNIMSDSITEAARIEIAIERFLTFGNYKGFTTTFEDLHGLHQLPGLAAQRLMQKGYGFAAEGDWKTAALLRAMKTMAAGLDGGNSFMEDYTYSFTPDQEAVLGSHMLEICPSIAEGEIRMEVHPLSIGGKADPARLVFNGGAGRALNASLVDMGDRFRLIVNEVEALAVIPAMPKLPVARVMWQPLPTMREGLKRWLEAGGAHHTVYSQNLCFETLEDFARIANIETIHIC